MKLKCRPDDFRVEEVPSVAPGNSGRFTFYRLDKQGLGTLEALDAIARRWNLARAQISFGGLKDRHASTTQYLTILGGPARPLRQTSFALEPQGKLAFPYGPKHFLGNRFSLQVRDIESQELAESLRALTEIPRDGLPNYFDDQRFGSVSSGGEFIAAAWLRGDHERALRLALAEPNPFDRPGTKAEKAILRELWGRWPEAKARLGRSHARSLVTYLADHPTDFKGAFARVRHELRSLYFSAYQSHLWNLLLASLIEQLTRADQRVLIAFKVATLPLVCGLEPGQAAELAGWQLPLPSARTKLPPDGMLRSLAESLMITQGLAWEQLRVKHLKDVFFSKNTRQAMFAPKDLTWSSEPDDLYPGRQKLRLQFELPRGSYATILIKRVTRAATAGSDELEPDLPDAADNEEMAE
jgi:tRNA pseudouridine13 synthase